MFPSGRQDRNSLSPIVHVSSLFASRDLSFLLCLPTRNSTTLVAWRIVAPLRIVRRTIYRVTCYRTRIINGVTASSNDIYNRDQLRDDLCSWFLLYLQFWEIEEEGGIFVEKWNWISRFFHEKYIPLFFKSIFNIPSIIVNIIRVSFFFFISYYKLIFYIFYI